MQIQIVVLRHDEDIYILTYLQVTILFNLQVLTQNNLSLMRPLFIFILIILL